MLKQRLRINITIWIASVILVIGLVITFFAAQNVKQNIENDAIKQYVLACDQLTLKIEDRLNAYSFILRGAAALFAVSSNVNHQEWKAYVNSLLEVNSIPGVQSLGFIKAVPSTQLTRYIDQVRSEGFSGYKVFPVSQIDLHAPIMYIEPLIDRNIGSLGYDLFSESVKRSALVQARNSGLPTLSGKIQLMQETGNEVQAGVFMFIPVFKNGMAHESIVQRQSSIIGWVFSPFRMNDLMTGIFQNQWGYDRDSLILKIYDGHDLSLDTLLYDSQPAVLANDDSLFFQQRMVNFNGVQWSLVFDRAKTSTNISYLAAWATLAGGLMVNGFLFSLLVSMINTSSNSIRLAKKLTQEIRYREIVLKDSKFRWKFAIEGSGHGLWDWDIVTGIVLYSKSWKESLGFDEIEIGTGFKEWEKRIHPDDKVYMLELMRSYFDGKISSFHSEHRLLCKNGSYKWMHEKAMIVNRDENGRPLRMIGIHTDITERKQFEEQLQLAASVFGSVREGIMITSAKGLIIDVNEAFTHITGYSRNEVIGRNPRFLCSGIQNKAFYRVMWESLLNTYYWCDEVFSLRKNGEIYAAMLTITTVCDQQGQILHYVALFSDITTLKEHKKQLEHIAYYDVLTNLPNRVLFSDRLHQAIKHSERSGQRLAVVFLDLDGFKAINDTHGHDAGDQLLIAVANRMKHTLREGDTLARLGGDEFVAMLLDVEDVEASMPLLNRLLVAAAQTITVSVDEFNVDVQVSASIGVTFFPQIDDVDADQLLRQADQAMYQAKLTGKGRFHVFDLELRNNARDHQESINNIHLALSEQEFELYYQPKINMRTGLVIGAEALIRWQHPQKGLLLPFSFLPIIENHPLAIELGEWVIETALTQIDHWYAEGLDFQVSVNISAIQLQQPDFVQRLKLLLAAHPNYKANSLELEVLETNALDDVLAISQVMESCRELGVNFALDDFGTGYSSLTYLRRLPAGLLKIDQSFVRDMLDDPNDLAIVEGIVSLARSFSRDVIAEGVETAEHGTLLLQLGCELAQGYGIARPMPAHQLHNWSKNWQPDLVWMNLISLSHDDLPLLFAGVEQRFLIVAIEAFLKGDQDLLMPLNDLQSRFEVLMSAIASSPDYYEKLDVVLIKSLYEKIQSLVVELCELKSHDKADQALARLEELHDLRHSLLKQMEMSVLS